jgi:hypothetical protein
MVAFMSLPSLGILDLGKVAKASDDIGRFDRLIRIHGFLFSRNTSQDHQGVNVTLHPKVDISV